MNRKTFIALMVSLFLLPGMGHVYLGKKVQGYLISIILVMIVLTLIVLFEWELMKQAQKLPDPRMLFTSIWKLAEKSWMEHLVIFWTGLGMMVLIWIGAAVDVVLMGRQQIRESSE